MYPINETFTSFQGEGVHMGRKAHFIRLRGCDVRCPWCDQAETWLARGGKNISAASLVKDIPTDTGIVVVTGGEPTLHNLAPLTEAIHAHRNLWGAGPTRAHLETAGHRPITGNWHWIALSPKPSHPPMPENVVRANEFKIIVSTPSDIVSGLLAIEDRRPGTPVWLHPESSRREDPGVLEAIALSVKGDVRAGWQLHKLYGAR